MTLDVFRAYMRSKHKDIALLEKHVAKLGSGAVYKRFGFLCEKELPQEKALIGKRQTRHLSRQSLPVI